MLLSLWSVEFTVKIEKINMKSNYPQLLRVFPLYANNNK